MTFPSRMTLQLTLLFVRELGTILKRGRDKEVLYTIPLETKNEQ